MYDDGLCWMLIRLNHEKLKRWTMKWKIRKKHFTNFIHSLCWSQETMHFKIFDSCNNIFQLLWLHNVGIFYSCKMIQKGSDRNAIFFSFSTFVKSQKMITKSITKWWTNFLIFIKIDEKEDHPQLYYSSRYSSKRSLCA